MELGRNGRYWLIENPHTSEAWRLKAMMRLRSRKDTCEALLDMCGFGMKDKCNGLLVKKATRILTNCEPIAVLLRKKCTRNH
eukprot:769013-Heterocapsa_arctica.AAC.1